MQPGSGLVSAVIGPQEFCRLLPQTFLVLQARDRDLQPAAGLFNRAFLTEQMMQPVPSLAGIGPEVNQAHRQSDKPRRQDGQEISGRIWNELNRKGLL